MDRVREPRPAGGAAPARVDVVVPMHDAAETIETALAALQAQTMPDWRALVVDNASRDDGPERVRRLAAADRRILLLSEAERGVSHARNRGLASAEAEWVLFFDADDRMAPQHLERLLAGAAGAPEVDAVVSGSARSTPDGRTWGRSTPDLSDPFNAFGQMGMLFPVHCALWRRSILMAQGGFDTSLTGAEDWDLWIRLARAGLRAAVSPEVTCFYVSWPNSLSSRPEVLDHALRVVRGAHRPDPARPGGPTRPVFDLPRVEFNLLVWTAARDLAAGRDIASVLDRLGAAPVCGFEFAHIADVVLEGLTVGAASPPEDLAARWPQLAPRLQTLFEALTARFGWARLFQSCHWALWDRIAHGRDLLPRPPTPGVAFARQDVRAPIRDIPLAQGEECLVLAVTRNGERLGIASAPVLGPGAPAVQLAQLAWQALDGAPASSVLRGAGLWAHPAFWSEALRSAAALCNTGLLRGLRRRGARAVWRERLRYVLRRGLGGALRARSVGDPAFAAAWREALAARTAAAQAVEPKPAPVAPDTDTASGQGYWEAFFRTEDPWQYDNPYETRKYGETLALLPRANAGRVLELACAEGHFTQRLAAQVAELIATDISATAVSRAQARCAGASHARFSVLDVLVDPLPQNLDAIFCSEFLYYLPPAALAGIARKLCAALRPGGVIIHAHALSLDDDRTRSAFDWRMPSTFTQIEAALRGAQGLVLRKEIASELYRVQLYERSQAGAEPLREFRPLDRPLPIPVARQVVEGGAVVRRGEAEWRERATRIPVLMYHRVTAAPHPALAQFAVSPAQFEAHLRLLRRYGYRAISPATLAQALEEGRSLPGRPVLITFDDGYVDFLEAAVPLLQRHDFAATVFAVPGRQSAAWDAARGEAAALMSAAQLRQARAEGMEIGSHSFSHQGLTRLARDALFAELVQSKAQLQDVLGETVAAIAYPFGDADRYVHEACALAGYRIGFSTRHAFATLRSNIMAVERLEVSGSTDAAKLAAMLAVEG